MEKIGDFYRLKDEFDTAIKLGGDEELHKGRPIFLAGPSRDAEVVYKYNRGLIAIGKDGYIREENLDGKKDDNNVMVKHVDVIIRITNGMIEDRIEAETEYSAGIAASQKGIVIMLLVGGSAVLFIPEIITNEQFNSLVECMKPRSNFTFSIYHGKYISTENGIVEFDYNFIVNYLKYCIGSNTVVPNEDERHR